MISASKARDYFSAYWDGTLEPGLAAALERRLEQDTELKAEYDEFVRVMAAFEDLSKETVETPVDLHDRIMARIDRQIYESKRATRPAGIFSLWRSLAYGGAATVLIIGGILALRGGDGAFTAGFGGASNQQTLAPELRVGPDRGLIVEWTPAGKGQLVLERDGATIDRQSSDRQEIQRALSNSSPEAELITIRVSPPSRSVHVALPGTARLEPNSGQGDVRSFALALAGTYGVPVMVNVDQLDRKVTWTLTGKQPSDAVNARVDAGLSVSFGSDGILRIN